MTAIRKAKAAAFERLEQTTSKGTQSVSYHGLFKAGPHKVRIRIKSDSYASQSFALAEVWSPAALQWNEVATIPHGRMQTPAKLYYLPNDDGLATHYFSSDANALLASVERVL